MLLLRQLENRPVGADIVTLNSNLVGWIRFDRASTEHLEPNKVRGTPVR
jgi:hypothetical protein